MKKVINNLCLLIVLLACTRCNKGGSNSTTTGGSSAKAITAFSFNALTPQVSCVIDNTAGTITINLPSGTNATNLVPTITLSPKATVSPGSGVAQDFTKTVTYTVTAEDGSKQVYVTILNLSNPVITTIAGNGLAGYVGDGGQATGAELNNNQRIAVDAAGNIYVSDIGNNRIRKISTTGTITTVAGNGTFGYTGDGGPATAACLEYIEGLAVDVAGNIYVACGNIRKISTDGIITTVAGGGNFSTNQGDDSLATKATLTQPMDILVTGAGDLIIADWGDHKVRMVSGTSGIIRTIAGDGHLGYSGDGGPATAADLEYPRGLALDAAGNLYIASEYFGCVRKLSPSGIITTVAGGTGSTYVSDGSPATAGIVSAVGLAIDAAGDLIMASYSQALIRKVNGTTGVISTIAGGGNVLGDGGLPTLAELVYPTGVALDAQGNLYIADYGSRRIRKVTW